MKLIRIQNNLTVILNNGDMLSTDKCTDEIYNEIVNNQQSDEVVKALLVPELKRIEVEVGIKTQLLEDFSKSKHLSVLGKSIYLKNISELTLPEDLAVAIHNAEIAEDKELLQSYLNFWTLASLNPDSRARTNLFWFLKRYGMTISKSGLFIAYRNVELKSEGSEIKTDLAQFISEQFTRVRYKLKKSPKHYIVGYDEDDELLISIHKEKFKTTLGMLDELYLKLSNKEVSPTYTDSYTKKFTIKIGEIVKLDREKCDSTQENTCSNGLHVAGRQWLANGYFGQISLVVLVNPTDVIAVPPDDNYGKMRTCAYYPIQLIKRDSQGEIIDEKIEDGFEDDFIDKICYQGDINNEDDANYSLQIPNIPEINRKSILESLDKISESMKKYVN